MSLEKIEAMTGKFAEAQAALLDVTGTLKQELEAVAKAHRKEIKKAVDRCATTGVALQEAILENPDLFESPRSQIFHGIKVGLQMGKRTLSYDDEERLIILIRKHLPDLEDVLIETTESVNRAALNRVADVELARLQVRIVEGVDAVIIKQASGGVDKAINAMLKDAIGKAEDSE